VAFFQILQVETDHELAEIRRLDQEWRDATQGQRSTQSTIVCRNRDNSNSYVVIVEFPSYEEAMRNSGLPATQRFAEQLQAISNQEPKFLNLDELYREEG
jgi:quinol monooxygenase YgiN